MSDLASRLEAVELALPEERRNNWWFICTLSPAKHRQSSAPQPDALRADTIAKSRQAVWRITARLCHDFFISSRCGSVGHIKTSLPSKWKVRGVICGVRFCVDAICSSKVIIYLRVMSMLCRRVRRKSSLCNRSKGCEQSER